MTANNKKLQMPAWLGIVLMPVMIIFSGIALVAYVSTMSLTILAIQAAGVVMAAHSFAHRIHARATQKFSHQ